MTIDDLRAKLRIELHDEDEARWADVVLDRHLLRAGRELAFVWPRERKSTLSTSAGSRELDVSTLTDRVRVLAVEYPVERYPPAYVQFSLWDDTLTLLVEQAPAGVEDVDVYWGSLHTLDAVTSTLPPNAEDAVITGAAGYAAIEWASFATNRANVAGRDTAAGYLAWGERKIAIFNQTIKLFGDQGRVRVSGLYTPERPATSQSAVTWEP